MVGSIGWGVTVTVRHVENQGRPLTLQMKGLFPLVLRRTSWPTSSSVFSIWASGYQKARVPPLGVCLQVIFTSSAWFTMAASCCSDRRSDSPLASVSAQRDTPLHFSMQSDAFIQKQLMIEFRYMSSRSKEGLSILH